MASTFVQTIARDYSYGRCDLLLVLIANLAGAEFLAPPFAEQPVAATVASTIVEICTQWEWI